MSASTPNGISSRPKKSSGLISVDTDTSNLNSVSSSKSQRDDHPSSSQESELISLRQRVKELEEKEKILERNIRQRQAECDEQKSALRTIQDEFMVLIPHHPVCVHRCHEIKNDSHKHFHVRRKSSNFSQSATK